MSLQVKGYRQIILYGISFAFLLTLLKWLEIRYVVFQNSFEIYAGAIALIFTMLGVWLALKLAKPTKIIEKEVFINRVDEFVFNQAAADNLGLSNREIEVLQLMANGLSNQEIADELFISLNTIKTHISRIFEKMNVKRRTQAIELAKNRSIISY
jgi:NarL family two-component system response regulator LiaR